MENNNQTTKSRLLGGLIYAAVGTAVVLLIEYFQDLKFNFLRVLVTFIIFWAFGYFIIKKNDTKRLD